MTYFEWLQYCGAILFGYLSSWCHSSRPRLEWLIQEGCASVLGIIYAA